MRAEEVRASVILARSSEGNLELQRGLGSLGISTESVETIRFEEPATWQGVDGAIAEMSSYDWVAFTSPRAVGAFVLRLGPRFQRDAAGPRIAAVGPKTADALKSAGLEVDFVPAEFLTSELGAGLPAEFGRRVLLLRADIGDDALVEQLERRGFVVKSLAVYRTVAVKGTIDATILERASVVAFASPSEVRGFKARVPSLRFAEILSQATAACIGPVTADAALEAGFRSVKFPDEHTVEGLIRTVQEIISDA